MSMKVRYRLTVHAPCPVDAAVTDCYEVTVKADRVIKVEDILAAVDGATANPIFQEDLAEELADMLGAKVEVVGIHSGVEVVARAS